MSKKQKQRIILCAGQNGRAIIIGYVATDPVPGEYVELHNARMVLRWDVQCKGLFGLATKGPAGDTRITHAVDRTGETVWQEWLTVSPEAGEAIDKWPAY